MKVFLLLAHLSICFAKDFMYNDKIANAKYGSFGATLATAGERLIVGTQNNPAPIFIVHKGKTEAIPPPDGVVMFGFNVAANEHFIITNGLIPSKGGPPSSVIYIYSAQHPHELVTKIPVDKRGFSGAAIDEGNTIVVVTQASTVMFYGYNGQRAWEFEKEFTIGKHSVYPSRAVTVSGDHAAVGMATYNGQGEGSVEIFQRANFPQLWKHTQTIKSSEYQYFGFSVSMHKDHLVIGATKDDKEQHAFIYRFNEYTAEPYRYLPEDHLTIPSPEGGYRPSFQVDCQIGDRHLIAVSTKLKGTVATKLFTEANQRWVEHADLKAEAMDPSKQSNAAVKIGANGVVYTGRTNPFLEGKGGAVYVHDLSKVDSKRLL